MSSLSVFDLSPSEKLQLVEDLWDDLAAVPQSVPVHDWQLEELALQKGQSHETSRVRPFLGTKSNAASAAVMAVKLVIASEA